MTRAIKASSSLEVDHRDVLAAAVKAIGGTERPGQVEMADAIAECLESDRHLLVQAGTGTGKSLGYLAPALLWLVRHPGQADRRGNRDAGSAKPAGEQRHSGRA